MENGKQALQQMLETMFKTGQAQTVSGDFTPEELNEAIQASAPAAHEVNKKADAEGHQKEEKQEGK